MKVRYLNEKYDPYEATMDKIEKNIKGLSLYLGQILDRMGSGDVNGAVLEMDDFVNRAKKVQGQIADYFDDEPVEEGEESVNQDDLQPVEANDGAIEPESDWRGERVPMKGRSRRGEF